jgi:hypothetical protein
MGLFKGRMTAGQYEDMLNRQLRMTASKMTVDRDAYEQCELVVEALCQGLRGRGELIDFVTAGIKEGRYNHLYECDSNGPGL